MKIKSGDGKTKYGPGVLIKLTGKEIATAVDTYLMAHGIIINGPRTILVNNNLIKSGSVYIDPSGFVIDNGKKYSGRVKIVSWEGKYAISRKKEKKNIDKISGL